MSTQPAWFRENDPGSVFPTVTADVETDVAIVGGGVTGITTAYLLAKAGKKVTLLEQNKLLSGDPGRTTAFLTYVVDAPLPTLKRTFGEKTAQLVWDSNRKAIDEIERIVRAEDIACDFSRSPAYVYGHAEEDRAGLKEAAELGRSLGFPVTFSDAPLPFKTHGYLFAPDQAKLHPVKYLQGLAARAQAHGAEIREQAHVDAVEGNDPVLLTTSGGRIRAKDVVIATHSPVTRALQSPAGLTAQRTYVLEAAVPSNALPQGLYWNTENPYHYFRIDRAEGEDLLIMGGEGHKTGLAGGQEEARFAALKSYFRELFPRVPMKFFARWSGQTYESIDGLPFIGRPIADRHHYVATGYNGNSMTFGTVAAMLLSSLILNGEHLWSHAYGTARPHGVTSLMTQGSAFAQERFQSRLRSDPHNN